MEQYERFDRIYAQTRDGLLRYLWVRTSAAPEAEDLFQEVYRKFYVRLSRSVLPILDSERYLYSIAKKELSRYYRQKAKRVEAEQPIETLTDLPAEDVPIDERLLTEERKDAVWRLLQNEPPLNRRIFVLFYACDRTQKEIAASLGIEETAVRQRLYRTRQRIRAALESQNPDL
ncbi:MAG: sigma-70 family RNA polymerase sigma factor [Clostridia bacterium]|nr:sigma-70 family RNA polymerase sigma factor [Clostridia bacterium]